MAKIVKIDSIADLHLRPNDPYGGEVRLYQKIRMLSHYIDELMDCDVLVILGDTYEMINPGNKVRSLFAHCVGKAVEKGVQIYNTLGNHETPGDPLGACGLDLGYMTEKYRVITEPTLTGIGLLIPEVSVEGMESALRENPKVPVFGHFGVKGARYPNGAVEENGVSPDLLKGRPCVLLGHIHSRQKLFQQVHYVGCFARANFSDANHPTGYASVSLKNGKIATPPEFFDTEDTSFVELPFVENKLTPKFTKRLEGSVVKLRFKGSHEWCHIQPVREYIKKAQDKGAMKVVVEYERTRQQASVDQKDQSSSYDAESLVTAYAKKHKKDPKAGLAYLRAAQEEGE